MKKVILVLFIFALQLVTISCDFMGSTKQAPSTPINVKLFDDTLTWDGSSLAEGYNIYADGELVDEVSGTTYIFASEISTDQAITVTATRTVESEVLESGKSQSVTRYKNVFSSSETMIFDFRSGYGTPYNDYLLINQSFEISNSIRYVKIIGDAGVTYNHVNFHIQIRNLPLTIDLENFIGEANYNHSVIYSDSPLEGDYLVTINSKGTKNELYAGINITLGEKGNDATVLFAVGGDGGVGEKGYAALYLPRVLIKGSANLTLVGGIGGIGGRGGNGNVNYGGDGGDGGTGGSGAEFLKMYIKTDSSTVVTFTGGFGGEGGLGGNSTPLTTPKEGDFGDNGSDYEGVLSVISGIVD